MVLVANVMLVVVSGKIDTICVLMGNTGRTALRICENHSTSASSLFPLSSPTRQVHLLAIIIFKNNMNCVKVSYSWYLKLHRYL